MGLIPPLPSMASIQRALSPAPSTDGNGSIMSQSSESIVRALGTSQRPDRVPIDLAASHFQDTMAQAKKIECWPGGISRLVGTEDNFKIGNRTGNYKVEGEMREAHWVESDAEGNRRHGGMEDRIDPCTGKITTNFYLVPEGEVGIEWEEPHRYPEGQSTPDPMPQYPRYLLMGSEQLAQTYSQTPSTPTLQGHGIKFQSLQIDRSVDGATSYRPDDPPVVQPGDRGGCVQSITENGRELYLHVRRNERDHTVGQAWEDGKTIGGWEEYEQVKPSGDKVPCEERTWYKNGCPVSFQQTIGGKDTCMF